MKTGTARPSSSMITRSGISKLRQNVTARRHGTVRPASTVSKAKTDDAVAKPPSQPAKTDGKDSKYTTWSKHAETSPFPDFLSPTPKQCEEAHAILEEMHGDTVRKNFAEMDDPRQAYPRPMDALVVAQLSQATSWSNAQRAMKSMADVYGSTFAYGKILDGGIQKLQDALRPGGMQNRKAKMLTQLLLDVKERHGEWNLDFLFKLSDEDAMKEVLRYHGIGPKSAFCLLSICLQRQSFAVDTHIYRITGLWGWRPKGASREKAQAHLDARIPAELKFPLHYLFIVHGRECPRCRGNGDASATCKFKQQCNQTANAEGHS
ncbi:hypothetical protein OPT61_g1070 [Boeremia exigua]|uniref:Uncharacterized protein n=1 Tax=Boeremia exigua TaxID=749465 RepID=A0ACC2IRM7_9PLEO|nr:hypothetical protein OPT61_g1070 [Boeremia exigua]